MVKIALYHQNKLITCHPVSGNTFSVGSDPTNDLVLAGAGIRDRHLSIFRDGAGRWHARNLAAVDAKVASCDAKARIALGEFALEVEVEDEGELIDMAGAAPRRPLDWTGESPLIQLLMNETQIVAPLRAPVLVTGETGTGKELVARGLHDLSNRRHGPFISVNCASLTDSLLEDTFFGHEKGAFTGASAATKGVFEQAHHGTLFLDEIGELPLLHQAALLRILEDRTVRRIGSEAVSATDFRLVAATNRDLPAFIAEGGFRADLYHRIATFTLETTSLRERPEDILPLAERFLCEMRDETGVKSLGEDARERLLRYSWPGNVRELRNVLLRAAALTRRVTLRGFDLDTPVEPLKTSHFRLQNVPVNRLERFVESFDGNITQAAKALGVARTTLRDRMNRAGLETDEISVDMAV